MRTRSDPAAPPAGSAPSVTDVMRVDVPASAPLLLVGSGSRSDTEPSGPGVLFVTEEVFLPHRNGSSQVYTHVARTYAAAGWRTHCLSFYRDPEEAVAPATLRAYRAEFPHFVLAPGWNLGGTLAGKVGMACREASRWLTGNVFPTHPLLAARRPTFRSALLSFVRSRHITQIYFHKPHTMLLLEPVLDGLRPAAFVLDLHDDFVARSEHYAAAYNSLFAALPWPEILWQHRPMYLRHRLGRTHAGRSRRRELRLLAQCDKICIASELEFERYKAFPELRGRVRHEAWPIADIRPDRRRAMPRQFHAGFIGADNVMNLDAVIYLRDRILPRVRTLLPAFRMLIAGTLARKAGSLLAGVRNVETWDTLPDVARFYDAIGVAVVPLRYGTGVSVKAIEALAHGCPLVTTSVGVRGIATAAQQYAGVDIVDDPDAFALALVRSATVDWFPDACSSESPPTATGHRVASLSSPI